MKDLITNTAIILAGGKGTRIRSVYPDLPKPLIPVAGKPFLRWQIEFLRKFGIKKVALSIGYMSEKIIDYFTKNPVENVEIFFAVEDKPLGTGGAVKFVAEKYNFGKSFVLNGDSFCPADLNDVNKIGECKAAILVSKKDDVADYGSVLTDENNGITAFIEKGKINGGGWVNAGVYFIDLEWAKNWSDKIPLSIENDIFPNLPPEELKVWRTELPFLDIGVPDRLEQAEEFLTGETDETDESTRHTPGANAKSKIKNLKSKINTCL